jgi:hypothetical protein
MDRKKREQMIILVFVHLPEDRRLPLLDLIFTPDEQLFQLYDDVVATGLVRDTTPEEDHRKPKLGNVIELFPVHAADQRLFQSLDPEQRLKLMTLRIMFGHDEAFQMLQESRLTVDQLFSFVAEMLCDDIQGR